MWANKRSSKHEIKIFYLVWRHNLPSSLATCNMKWERQSIIRLGFETCKFAIDIEISSLMYKHQVSKVLNAQIFKCTLLWQPSTLMFSNSLGLEFLNYTLLFSLSSPSTSSLTSPSNYSLYWYGSKKSSNTK
jgi:hypothetical protein